VNYPTFEPVAFPESAEIRAMLHRFPEAQEALFVSGVAKEFDYGNYHADNGLSLIGSDRGRLVRFASGGLADAIGIDPDTGGVVYVVNVQEAPTAFVNSSLPQFTRTLKAIIERFPYYDRSASDEEIDSVSHSLESIINNIDPPALLDNRYWSTFISDCEIGDLATEVLSTRRRVKFPTQWRMEAGTLAEGRRRATVETATSRQHTGGLQSRWEKCRASTQRDLTRPTSRTSSSTGAREMSSSCKG
jgi:SUKH-4 immunity protein